MPCPRCLHNPVLVTDGGQIVALVSPLPEGIEDHAFFHPVAIKQSAWDAPFYPVPLVCGACGMVFCRRFTPEEQEARAARGKS